MAVTLDRALKLIWVVIGAVLLIVLLGGGVAAVVSWSLLSSTEQLGAGGAAADEASGPAPEAATLRYEVPQPVLGTAWRTMEVYRVGPNRAGIASYGPTRDAVNVIFLSPAGEARLAFDRPVLLRAVDVPREPADSLQRWVVYDAVVRDGDGDGALTPGDPSTLFVGGLDGLRLRAVLPEGLVSRGHATLGDGRMLVLALVRPAGAADATPSASWPQRAFVYEVDTARLVPLAAVDSLAERARALAETKPAAK
jgi:hypothetical protein